MVKLKKIHSVADFDRARKEASAERNAYETRISIGCTSCSAADGPALLAAFRAELARHGLEDKVLVRLSGCHGFCAKGPLVVFVPHRVCYVHVKPGDAKEIVEETALKNNIVDRLVYKDPKTGQKCQLENQIPFYKRQLRLIMDYNKRIDPRDLRSYLAIDGYEGLIKALTRMTPEDVILEVKNSGLRGRGGAGFPTGFKWEFCRKAKGKDKFIICNADEGDPGAYMDRSVMESNPHSVLEGMITGAYAIGANEGYVYVRNEYPLAVEHVKLAIEQAYDAGLLGRDILGTGFDFDVRVERGAGAFVCGEETALIASIEGRRGEPRQRPPFPATKGLYGKPTNINNVETWANIPLIMTRGASWYSHFGTRNSKGTKIFSLVGKVRNTGLVEVAMGSTFREIIYDIGGGIQDDRQFKAVQTGGPSGGCIPAEHLDKAIDYESLSALGTIMGSGGMIVMDDRTCMVDVARYFMNFLRGESCGKCLTCREGTQRLWETLNDICEGRGKPGHLRLIEELAHCVKDASLCGLGQTAGNPVLSTLRYFRREYEEHINEKLCRAGVCKPLIEYLVVEEQCVGCLLCKKACPQDAISGQLKQPHLIDSQRCIKCGLCYTACKSDAIKHVKARELCHA